MTKAVGILIFVLLSMQLFGQARKRIPQTGKVDLIKKIESINDLLKAYDTLSPFSDMYSPSDMIDSMGNEIRTRLLNLLNDQRIIHVPIETLLDQGSLSISTSEDHRVYFFSLDEKTGGSYKSNKTILHYRLMNGIVKASLFDGEASDVLATSAYGPVYLLDSVLQKYFVIGSVRTCNTCIASVALTLTLDSNSYHIDLLADYKGRDNDLLVFDYDSTEKVFTYEYYPAGNEDIIDQDHQKDGPLQQQYRSRFQFIRGAFEELDKSEFREKHDD